MVPAARPALVSALSAAVCVKPTTLGTATCGGPEEATSATALPAVTCVPAAGDWLITEPAGTVVLLAVVTRPTRNPALLNAVVAAVCVKPTTDGTVTGGAPDETSRATALPLVTCAPPAGF